MKSSQIRLEHEWYDGEIPANVVVGNDVFIQTAHGFVSFFSRQNPGLVLGDGAGVYDRTTFVVGPEGRITVGPYTCLNGTYLICHDRITIGAHCLLAWGSVVTDAWIGRDTPVAARRAALHAAAADPNRRLPAVAPPRLVVLEDNVWVGFDSVILPGVTLGRGCVVGCKTIISEDIPPYAVVVGDPPRIRRFLEPDDTEAARECALREYVRA
jgi:acetyltransferase-like isoleucine patch superfamily enzyme